jgi:uncharacterized membrane protein
MKPDTSTPKRTFFKALSWESFSNLVCFGLAYWMFGNIGGCAIFTGVCFVIKIGLFFLHDRIWHTISWGKK